MGTSLSNPNHAIVVRTNTFSTVFDSNPNGEADNVYDCLSNAVNK